MHSVCIISIRPQQDVVVGTMLRLCSKKYLRVTWVIEPSRLMAELDLRITVHIPYKDGKAALHRVSVLKIRSLPEFFGESNCTPLLDAIHDHFSQVKSGKRRRYSSWEGG